MPFWGTCMGMIVAAHDVAGLRAADARSDRHHRAPERVRAADRSRPKFRSTIPALGGEPFPGRLHRAPWVERAGPGVEVLATHEGHGVFVRSGNVMGTSFHPELTPDGRVHDYFVREVVGGGRAAA